MGDDSSRLTVWFGRQVLQDCAKGVQRCHECQDWMCCDNLNPRMPEEHRACKRLGPRPECRDCGEQLCSGTCRGRLAPAKEGKPPMLVRYRIACWFSGWLVALALLFLAASGRPCGR